RLEGQAKTAVESRLAKIPPSPLARVSRWQTQDGTMFKFSELGERVVLLQLEAATNKVYSKIDVMLLKVRDSWSGTGVLYFRDSPDRRYETKAEIRSGDRFT